MSLEQRESYINAPEFRAFRVAAQPAMKAINEVLSADDLASLAKINRAPLWVDIVVPQAKTVVIGRFATDTGVVLNASDKGDLIYRVACCGGLDKICVKGDACGVIIYLG